MSNPLLPTKLASYLVKHKSIVRREEGKQNVSYQLNTKRYSNIKKTIERQIEINKLLLDNQKTFNELSLEDQIFVCLSSMLLRNLRQLRIEVNNGLNPGNDFQTKLEVMFINNPVHRFYERILFTNSVDDKEYGEKVLKKLDEAIEDGMKELFKSSDERTEKLKKQTSNQEVENE